MDTRYCGKHDKKSERFQHCKMEIERHRNRHQRRKQIRVPGRDFQGQQTILDLQFPVISTLTDHPRTFWF